MICEPHQLRISDFERNLLADLLVIGFSIKRSDDGYEPCYVYLDHITGDLKTAFLPIYPIPMSSSDAIKLGRRIAKLHKKPFRSRLSAFKSLIKEDSSDA